MRAVFEKGLYGRISDWKTKVVHDTAAVPGAPLKDNVSDVDPMLPIGCKLS